MTRRPATRAIIAVAILAVACSSNPAPSTSLTPAHSTESVPTATAPAEPPDSPPATFVAETAAAGTMPRKLPPEIDGLAAIGLALTQSVFVGRDSGAATVFDSSDSLPGFCAERFWTMRWRSLSGQPVSVGRHGWNAVEGMPMSDVNEVVSSGNAGYITGSGCDQPLLGAVTTTGMGYGTDEVLVEYQFFGPTIDGPSSPEPYEAADRAEIILRDEPNLDLPDDCMGTYLLAFDLPLAVCQEGRTIGYVQSALFDLGYDVDSDGLFGPSTRDAIRAYQTSQDLPADGVVGERTWDLLMVGRGLPGNDYNGDGVVRPDELGE